MKSRTARRPSEATGSAESRRTNRYLNRYLPYQSAEGLAGRVRKKDIISPVTPGFRDPDIADLALPSLLTLHKNNGSVRSRWERATPHADRNRQSGLDDFLPDFDAPAADDATGIPAAMPLAVTTRAHAGRSSRADDGVGREPATGRGAPRPTVGDTNLLVVGCSAVGFFDSCSRLTPRRQLYFAIPQTAGLA
jgi:hypothetical protein